MERGMRTSERGEKEGRKRGERGEKEGRKWCTLV